MRRPRDGDSQPLGFDQGGHLFTDEEAALLKAVEAYKARTHKRYLSVTEILFVLKSLGYRKANEG